MPGFITISPSGEQPEYRTLARELLQPIAGCIATFHKNCCYTKRAGVTTNLTLWNHWGMFMICQNTNAGICSMEKNTLRFMFKTYSTFDNVLLSTASSQQAARSACSCETRLSWCCTLGIKKHVIIIGFYNVQHIRCSNIPFDIHLPRVLKWPKRYHYTCALIESSLCWQTRLLPWYEPNTILKTPLIISFPCDIEHAGSS